jgi:hypothetical protein
MHTQSSLGSAEAVILITDRFELSHCVYHVFRPIIAQRIVELEFVVFICLILFPWSIFDFVLLEIQFWRDCDMGCDWQIACGKPRRIVLAGTLWL